MTKIVYNSCYGGFNLSFEAVEYLASLKHEPTCSILEIYKDKIAVSNRNHKDSQRTVCYLVAEKIQRHDTLLVQTVEFLKEKASGECSKLEIETIYDSKYRIKEYDGKETVMCTADDYDWISIED